MTTMADVGGQVITMRGDEVIEDGVVVVTGNRITAVGPRASTTVPAGAHVVDVAGKTVMPGLIDAHWHGGMGRAGIIPQESWVNYASLGFGVTTIHDPSNDTGTIFAASEMGRAGLTTAPRIYSTGTILYGAAGSFKAIVDSPEDALFHLKRMQAVGAFSVKSYNQPRREQRQQIIEAARELGMSVVPEGGALFQHNMSMVMDGHTGIEHSLPIPHVYDDVVQFWSQSDAGRRIGRSRRRELLVPAHRRLGQRAPADVRTATGRRRPLAPSDPCPRRRVEPHHGRCQREEAERRRCDREHWSARSAGRPGGALGDLDVRAGRNVGSAGSAHGYDQSGAVPRDGLGPRVAREWKTGRRDRDRR